MTHTTLIAINALLDLAAVFAVFAIVRFTHGGALTQRRANASEPAPAEDLAEAA